MIRELSLSPAGWTRAVTSIAAELGGAEEHREEPIGEMDLWMVLVTCILGSATRFEQVRTAALEVGSRISAPSEHEGCLDSCLMAALVSPVTGRGKVRFARQRVDQIARSYRAIVEHWGSLGCIASSELPVAERRRWLVESCPGLGFKQASLFLRDAGASEGLAVLDRHLIRYLQFIGLVRKSVSGGLTGASYEAAELALATHAYSLGIPLRRFDRATWIVLRAASARA